MGLLAKAKVVLTPQCPTVGDAVAWATTLLQSAKVDTPRLDAECLLASLLGRDRLHIYTAPQNLLPSHVRETYGTLVARRQAREPLAYLTGTKEFWSLSFKVNPAVLIPRPETEILVEKALSRVAELQAPVIADIGTGSGAIAVAVANALPRAKIYATEICGRALEVARENAEAHGVLNQIMFLHGDLLQPLFARGLGGQIDLLVSNPPYIATRDLPALPPEVRYEPGGALDGGQDGLTFYRRIIGGASALLRPAGWLALEMATGQGGRLTRLLRDKGGFSDVAIIPDLSGGERVIIARRMGPGAAIHPGEMVKGSNGA